LGEGDARGKKTEPGSIKGNRSGELKGTTDRPGLSANDFGKKSLNEKKKKKEKATGASREEKPFQHISHLGKKRESKGGLADSVSHFIWGVGRPAGDKGRKKGGNSVLLTGRSSSRSEQIAPDFLTR